MAYLPEHVQDWIREHLEEDIDQTARELWEEATKEGVTAASIATFQKYVEQIREDLVTKMRDMDRAEEAEAPTPEAVEERAEAAVDEGFDPSDVPPPDERGMGKGPIAPIDDGPEPDDEEGEGLWVHTQEMRPGGAIPLEELMQELVVSVEDVTESTVANALLMKVLPGTASRVQRALYRARAYGVELRRPPTTDLPHCDETEHLSARARLLLEDERRPSTIHRDVHRGVMRLMATGEARAMIEVAVVRAASKIGRELIDTARSELQILGQQMRADSIHMAGPANPIDVVVPDGYRSARRVVSETRLVREDVGELSVQVFSDGSVRFEGGGDENAIIEHLESIQLSIEQGGLEVEE